jgi:large subunit ribosomal protein L20
MTRVKRGTQSVRKREKILKRTRGFRFGRKSKERAAREALLHAGAHAFRGRKERARNLRSLWTVRLNAAVREHGLSYSAFIKLLKDKKIGLDRKVLAEIADKNPDIFKKIIEQIQS